MSELIRQHLLYFEVHYILYYPGRKGEELYSLQKGYSVEEAIKKCKNQKNWYEGDRHSKAKIRIIEVRLVEKDYFLEYFKEYKNTFNDCSWDNDPSTPDGIYR